MRIFGRTLLPAVPANGTKIVPLLNADQIFQAEQDLIESTRFGESLYLSQYSLPFVHEVPSTGTPASAAQRQMLGQMEERIRKDKVKAFIVADNSVEIAAGKRNEETIRWLHEAGANVLSYPMKYVSIVHPKFMANQSHAVITSANLSSHSADSPDDNTGLLLSGAAVQNGIAQSFLPQWRFSALQDERGWASKYPDLIVDSTRLFDEKAFWLNTAPKEESGRPCDDTQIFDAYRMLIHKAASGPPRAYLYLEHFDLSNLQLLRHLLYARHVNPTVDVRFILDPNQYLEGLKAEHDARAVAYDEVKNAGIPVRFARVKAHPNGSKDPQRFHDKFAVYNDAEVINGSGNFSSHSLNGNGENPLHHRLHNREVDVLVRDAGCAKAFKEKFLEDWAYRSFDDPHVAAGEGFNNGNVKYKETEYSRNR